MLAIAGTSAVVVTLAQFLSRPLVFGEDPLAEARWIAGAEEAFRLDPPQRIGGETLGLYITEDSRFVLFTEVGVREAERMRASVQPEDLNKTIPRLPEQLPLRYWDARSGGVGTIMEYDPRENYFSVEATVQPLQLVLLSLESAKTVERGYIVADFRHAKTLLLPKLDSVYVPSMAVLADSETVLFWNTVFEEGEDPLESFGTTLVYVYDHRAGRLVAEHALGDVDIFVNQGRPYLYEALVKRYWSFDPRTGRRELLESVPDFNHDLGDGGRGGQKSLNIRSEEMANQGGSYRVRGHFLEAVGAPEERFDRWADVWLGSEDQYQDVALAPNESFLVHTGELGTYVRRIERVPIEVFLSAASREMRDEAVEKAKMSSLATLMYSGDYDDSLPMAHNFTEAVLPYTKNMSVLEGFDYLLDSAPAPTFGDPADTVMGTVETPFGRAEAMLDGSVRWVPYD
ncbi:MAG: hypothetical protein ACOCX1_00170 [Fimbriimonadaceae bacterium]